MAQLPSDTDIKAGLEFEQWQRDMLTSSDTQVSDSGGTSIYQGLENEQAFLSVLASLCVTHSCDLAVTGLPNTDGKIAVALHMKLSPAQVFAFIASAARKQLDCNVYVNAVNFKKRPD